MFHHRSSRVKNLLAQSSVKNWRIYFISSLVILASGAILLKLVAVQVYAHQTYSEIAQDQRKFFQELVPRRGEIYLQNGEDRYPLAVNQERMMAYASPREIEEADKTALIVSSVLNLDKEWILEKIGDREDPFEILKHKLSQEEIQQLKEIKIKGIYLYPETFRFYPAGELASQLVGFVGSNGNEYEGRYGVELSWQSELKGTPGSISQEKDSLGRWISIAEREVKKAVDGINLVLTVNYDIQYEAEKVLKETVEKHQALGGTAIVMEPKTGRILALANIPNFNPNEYGSVENMSLFVNSAVNTPYECGSVFKPLTLAMGIEEKKVNPATVYVDTGVVREAGYEIKNSDEKSYGTQTMTQVLEKSLNTGAIFVEKMVGNEKFSQYLKNFGFGEKTGVELPGESSGNMTNLKNLNRDINFMTASFGQGITVTPLQLANAYAALANGGMMMKPQIVQKIVRFDGTEEEISPQELRRVVSQDTATQIGKMLRSVVTNGHGKRADVPGYLVGGKTGTAQVAKIGSKGYEEDLTVGSFVGLAPIDDPQFVVLVKIDNPKGVQWAESTAAPAFGKIMKFVLEHYNVEPTEPVNYEKLNLSADNGTPLVDQEKKKEKNKKD